MLINFTDDDFHSKVKNEEISILQFSASWCGPCKILKPIMEKLSEEYKDKANFYYADIDEAAMNTATSAAVRGVPTVVVPDLDDGWRSGRMAAAERATD